MLFSGIQRFTLIDYPGKIACVLFSPGCNMRCGFCHNMEFVLPGRIRLLRGVCIGEESLNKFLTSRKGKLTGVVFSGGEPTQWPDLLDVMRRVKEQGFCVKLDTNGSRPQVLQQALDEGLVDAVALDIKTSLGNYQTLTGLDCGSRVAESIARLKSGVVWYECRTTLIEEVHSESILNELLQDISGVSRYALQTFRPEQTLREQFSHFHALSLDRRNRFLNVCRQHVAEVIIR